MQIFNIFPKTGSLSLLKYGVFVLVFFSILPGCQPKPNKPAFRFQQKGLTSGEKKDGKKLNEQFLKLYKIGKFLEAQKSAEQAYAEVRNNFGVDSPKTLVPIINLGLVNYSLNNYREAELFFEQALETLSNDLWPTQPDHEIVENSLSLLYIARGRQFSKGELFKEAKNIRISILLPNHPDIAVTLNNLAVLYNKREKKAKAMKLLEEANKIWNSLDKQEDPNEKVIRNNFKILQSILNKTAQKNDDEVPKIVAGSGDPQKGKIIFGKNCSRCHGDKGDGKGPVGNFLNPRPRDFTKGKFKFRTTPSGKLPTDQNLFKTIYNGIPGTGMPTWKGVLTNTQITNVLEYVKIFSRKFKSFKKKGKSLSEITIGPKIPSSPQSIKRGREIYNEMECWRCHGESGRGSGPSNSGLKDDWGRPIQPANFHKPWNLKGGNKKSDIYMRFNTGLNGTPMPSFNGNLNNEKSWDLANFVRSLGPKEKPKAKEIVLSIYVKKEISMDYNDPIWQRAERYYFPVAGKTSLAERRYWSNIESLYLKTLHNDAEIAFMIEWDDRNFNPSDPVELPAKELEEGKESEEFDEEDEFEEPELPNECNDAFFLQFLSKTKLNAESGYFTPGTKKKITDSWYWESKPMDCQKKIFENLMIKKRPEDSLTSIGIQSKAFYEDGRWILIFKRKMKTGIEGEFPFETGTFIPFSFHARDGQDHNEDKDLVLPRWQWLVLQPDFSGKKQMEAIALKLEK